MPIPTILVFAMLSSVILFMLGSLGLLLNVEVGYRLCLARAPYSGVARILVGGGVNVSISSAGDAVNHRIDEPVQRCQKTHYHQYIYCQYYIYYPTT